MRVVLSDASKSDLREIGDYIARDNVANAQRFVDRLGDACLSLSMLSERYAVDARLGLRKRPVGNYIVFYRVTDRVEIVRILHGARDWISLLRPDE